LLSTFGAKGIVIFMNASQLLMHVAPIVGDLNVRLGFPAESPTHHIPIVCSDSNSHSYTKHSLKNMWNVLHFNGSVYKGGSKLVVNAK